MVDLEKFRLQSQSRSDKSQIEIVKVKQKKFSPKSQGRTENILSTN